MASAENKYETLVVGLLARLIPDIARMGPGLPRKRDLAQPGQSPSKMPDYLIPCERGDGVLVELTRLTHQRAQHRWKKAKEAVDNAVRAALGGSVGQPRQYVFIIAEPDDIPSYHKTDDQRNESGWNRFSDVVRDAIRSVPASGGEYRRGKNPSFRLIIQPAQRATVTGMMLSSRLEQFDGRQAMEALCEADRKFDGALATETASVCATVFLNNGSQCNRNELHRVADSASKIGVLSHTTHIYSLTLTPGEEGYAQLMPTLHESRVGKRLPRTGTRLLRCWEAWGRYFDRRWETDLESRRDVAGAETVFRCAVSASGPKRKEQ